MVAVTEFTVDADSYMDLSELRNITEHLLTDNCFSSFVYFIQFTHLFVIIVKSMARCLMLQINMLPFYCLRKWGWGQLYVGMDGDGDDLETSYWDRGGD